MCSLKSKGCETLHYDVKGDAALIVHTVATSKHII